MFLETHILLVPTLAKSERWLRCVAVCSWRSTIGSRDCPNQETPTDTSTTSPLPELPQFSVLPRTYAPYRYVVCPFHILVPVVEIGVPDEPSNGGYLA